MESSSLFSSLLSSTTLFDPLRTPTTTGFQLSPSRARLPPSPLRLLNRPRPGALKGPRGFAPSSPPQKDKKRRQNKRSTTTDEEDEEDEADEEEEEDDDDDGRDGTIPEVVTNRMMRRMGVSIGAPLAVGLLFFPLFYYLKVVAKVEVPQWLPFAVSFVFFGTALLGVSYGIVSASWDPLREGSLLGWNEARRNWPVFWQSLGANASSSSRRSSKK